MTQPPYMKFTQLDTTDFLGENENLSTDDWFETVPINSLLDEPKSMGLPAADANEEEVYVIASKLSERREQLTSNDGVYCPICHIANIDISNFRTPCPQCGRSLLSFGWSGPLNAKRLRLLLS